MAAGTECGVNTSTRSGKLSHCTRKMNEIKTLMKEGADVVTVDEGAKEFLRLLEEFKRCHESIQGLLPEDMRMNETLNWYNTRTAATD